MGNTHARGTRKFLDPDPSWHDYYVAEWRSERSKDLDRHGGPGRPPVARGDSVTAKLVFLEGALRNEQKRMKHVLQHPDEDQKREQAQKAQQDQLPDFILNTDLRAYERLHSSEALREDDPALGPQQHRDFSLLSKDPSLRKKMMEQRTKMMEYAKGVNVTKGAPGIVKPLNLPAIKSKVASNWKGADHGGRGETDEGGEGGEGGHWSSPAATAEWRIRMHQARRRTMLVVSAVMRWQLALSKRPGPKRLPRVNSFSYFIPQVLGFEARRFIEEATVVAKIKADAAKLEEPPQPPPTGEQPAEGEQETAAETPERAPRAVLRRGVSDSGFQSAAAAAAAAVAVASPGGVELTGGSGSAGPLASGMVRPKKRPELRKSSSAHLAGHDSNVEPYGAPRRLYSSKCGSTRLPSISGGGAGRFSSSGSMSAGPHDSGMPQAPRQPRGKLSRVSSSGQGRTSRRQSDSALAAAVAAAALLPPGTAAAQPPRGVAGATASRVGSAVAALVRRGVQGGGGRARASDCGSSRMRWEASETGGGGSSGFMAGLRQSLSGAAGPGNHNLHLHHHQPASPRRSEAGGGGGGGGHIGAANSAPPESPSSGAAGGFFLPRISSSNSVGVVGGGSSSGGGANGNGNGGGAGKPLTLAQARRSALMAEAGNLSGNSDDGSRAAMSPSRLGPLKLGNGTANSSGSSRSPDKAPGGSPGTASILDVLRQSKEGGLREALASCSLINDTHSPLNSPGMRARATSLDANFPGLASGLGELGRRAASDTPTSAPIPTPPPGHLLPISASSSGPPPPPVPDHVSSTATDDELPPPISPTAPLPSPVPPPGPPPSIPPPLRPSVAAPAAHTSPSPLAPPSSQATAALAAAVAGLPPMPPGKPPLGPGGERVRSGRANSLPAPDSEAAIRVGKAQQLMGMYANRVNATWAESQQWAAPTVLSVPEQEAFCASDAWVPYKVTVQRMIKSGSLAVHIDACADVVQLPDGTVVDVWTSDPWVLAQKLRPGSLPLSERIEGVSLGARAVQQLVLTVEALAGKEAVPKLTVVLAINDDQRNAVVADIVRTRSYGLKPENLVLTAQRKRCGYRYDKDAQAFLEDPATPPEVLGSGFALCQLAWLGDAFFVSREGELVMLMGRTLLERFADSKVEWLVARRARDLALLTPEGVLDLQHLAFAMFAADRHSGNMVAQAAPASSVTIPRAYDSTLLALKAPPAAAVPTRISTIAASAAGVEGGGGGAGVVDLRAAELSSPLMVEALAGVRKQAGHDGWVGLQRYLLHVPTLHTMLNTLGIFRPKLTMAGDVARLSLDAGDITADKRVACVAVHTRTSPAILTSPNEVDDLIPLLLTQDRSAAFRDIISSSNEAGADSSGYASSSAAADGSASTAVVLTTKPGIRILLYVASNEVTQLAVNLVLLMARPGRDVVHLVTVVHNSLQTTTGQALVLKYLKQISNAMIEAHAEVLVKGMSGLLEQMEGAANKLAPNLVVMASAALTMSNLNTASVMGSVTLSVLKRLTLPVAVATSNSKHLVLTQRRTALRCMVLVDPTSRPALNFMCSSCMEPMRGDKLVLAGHYPTRQMTTQQQQTQRRLIDNFGDIASSHRFHTPLKMQLDGPVDRALSTAADEETVHLVGLQVPLGTKGVPGHVLGLIRSCKGGVLVFRDTL